MQAARYIQATGHANAYTFTKHMTEEVARELHLSGVPTAVVRPAIVAAVAYDPCPGYFGNTIAGPTALVLAYASGQTLNA